MFGSRQPKKASSSADTEESFEIAGPSTSTQPKSQLNTASGISSVFRRQRPPTQPSRPWTATKGNLADVDSAVSHRTTKFNNKTTYKYAKEEDSGSLQSFQNGNDPPKPSHQKANFITFSADDLEAYSDIEDIGFKEDKVPEVKEDVFARPLSSKKMSRQFIHRPSSIKSQRFKQFRHRTKSRRNISLPETNVLEIKRSEDNIDDSITPTANHTLKAPKNEERKSLEKAYSPQIDVDLAPQIDEDKKVVQVNQKNPGKKPENPVLPTLEVVEQQPSPVKEKKLIVVTDLPAANHANTPSALANENAAAFVENGIVNASTAASPYVDQSVKRSIYKTISRRIAKLRKNQVGDSAVLETIGATKLEPLDDQNKGPFNYFWKKMVFDSSENYFYYWLAVVSAAYVYNLLVVIARSVFRHLAAGYLWILWLCLDVLVDFIYILDMLFRSRTGYLEQGILIRDTSKTRSLYFSQLQFKMDLASILPVDYILGLILIKREPAFRFNRLLRHERIQKFMEQTETRSTLPNAFRVGVVVWYIAVIIHWNACFYFMISEAIGLGSDAWVYGKSNNQSLPLGINDTLTRRYIYSFYWSTLILTTIGEVPGPQANVEFAFVTLDLMCGVLIFATIVGNVGSMISNMGAARADFQNRIDSIKQYMELRKVGKQLETRVIKWFDYLWANKQSLTDQATLKVLPDKLQAEIAMHVHFETLRKVRIFQDCEAGLLAELVLKLQLQVFSPMDYVCRKGDIGREMYIVKRGMLQVVADDGLKVFATLSEGAVFGELSILNIAGSKNGNRRTANVRSVGYTDLFVLNKDDLWIALKEYPEARKVLIQKGRELLRKDNLLDETAPEDNKTVEEISEDLQSSVRILQTRIARLTAEHTNTETKLQDRIVYLEKKLKKYGAEYDRQTQLFSSEEDDEMEGEDEEEVPLDKHLIERERQKLLVKKKENF